MKRYMKRYLRLVAAVAALATAGAAWAAFYFSQDDSPFSLKVSFGTPILAKLPEAPSDDGVSSDGKLSIGLPVALTNSGDIGGCVADIALKVSSVSANTTRVLYPSFVLDVERYIQSVGMKKPFLYAVTGPARSIVLPANQTIDAAILFLPHQPQLSISYLQPEAAYEFSIYVMEANVDCLFDPKNEWKHVGKAVYVFKDAHLFSLENGMLVLPVDEERDSLRTNKPPV